jgi:23S rRNA (cytosine1962-C5)-methyltransferase
VSRPLHAGGDLAETRFAVPASASQGRRQRPHKSGREPHHPKAELQTLEAQPLTGRTHQIRVHAADSGFPILGDTLYGGTPAARVYLHATELSIQHPVTGQPMTFRAPVQWLELETIVQPRDLTPNTSSGRSSRRESVGWTKSVNLEPTHVGCYHGYEAPSPGHGRCVPHIALRAAIIEPEATNAYRLVHGASDGWPGWYVDRFGDYLLSQSEAAATSEQKDELEHLMKASGARGAYHKILTRHLRRTAAEDNAPRLLLGQPAPERFAIRENGALFEVSFSEGYSVGLFLDQRDNRRRLLTGHVTAGFEMFAELPPLRPPPRSRPHNRPSAVFDGDEDEDPKQRPHPTVLNTFAYTCGFSVCAAKAGARTTSLDLSKKYLEWGKRNFALNGLAPEEHAFIYGDVFEWLGRLARRRRQFDVILLDPPTFSQSKASGAFRADKDYRRLIAATLPLLKSGGVLFASTNAADWRPEHFLAAAEAAIGEAQRTIIQLHYAPQPPDFPVSRAEPAYLKTVWLRAG